MDIQLLIRGFGVTCLRGGIVLAKTPLTLFCAAVFTCLNHFPDMTRNDMTQQVYGK